jgi:3-oxoacyl-[acyl-carrier protein] reductase
MGELNFRDKTVLVVGGSSGIGNGIAHGFRSHGANVHVWGTRENADAYDADDGSNLDGLQYAQVDVSNADSLERAARGFALLDVLILCQGTVLYKRQEFTRVGWNKVMEVNINSVMHTATQFHDRLQESGGSLIIISSVSGLQANIGNPAYGASKAGAINLTKTLGQAWARDGIRVNGVAPGLVATKLTKVTTDNPKRMALALQSIPVGREGTPEDMAGAALFLASPMASYICGHTIVVDGGLTL